ncbi:trigger factor [Candidatus Pacearchaeota archaeon]|jgi:trigger factor|nr:trigger factor [Candidatus Pacearchaeota archaeon]
MQDAAIVEKETAAVSEPWSADTSLPPIPGEVKFPIVKILEEPEYCKLKVHYEADPEVVIGKIDEAVAECRKLQVPGFRKGKAPDQAIKIRLRPQINQYVVREMATHAIDDIIFETNIKPIGQPKFSDIKVSKNNFACDVELTKKPEFELCELKFEVAKPVLETDEEALAEKSLYNLRLRMGEIQPYEENDLVENGDQVTFSFVATIEGEPFDGSTVEGEMYTVGSNRWTGFDQNLLRMKAEDVRDFEFKFEDGPLSGKTAKFSVTIHMGTKNKPHPLNEEFYQIMGVQNVEELLNKLRSISKMSIERSRQDAIRAQVASQLLDKNKFEIPKFIIEDEARYISSREGISFTTLPDGEKAKFLEQAERNARLSLILDSIRESEPDSVLNEIEARNMLTSHIQAQGGDPARIFNNPAHAAMLLNSIKDEFTLQWVADKATIIE